MTTLKKESKKAKRRAVRNELIPYKKNILDPNLRSDLKGLSKAVIENYYDEIGFNKKFKIGYYEALKMASDSDNPQSDSYLFKVLTWNKGVVGEDWFKTRMLKAERERDADFLKSVADAIKNTKDNRFSRKSSLDELLPYIKAFETTYDYSNPKEREKIRDAYECEFREIVEANHPFLKVLSDETAFYKWLKRRNFID